LEKFYKSQFDLWFLSPNHLNRTLLFTWVGIIQNENIVMLKFEDHIINITVPDLDNKNDDSIFYVNSNIPSWDTFVNDFIMNSSFNCPIHFVQVLDKLLQTANPEEIKKHQKTDQNISPEEKTPNPLPTKELSMIQLEPCGSVMLRLEPLIIQARTKLKESKQYKITLNPESNEWLFKFPIHDIIKKAVAKALLLKWFVPVTICLKLQLKNDTSKRDPEGELTVLRVLAYQNRSEKHNIHLRDIAWDFIYKNWGRVQYWVKFGNSSTSMLSTESNHIPLKDEKSVTETGKKDDPITRSRSQSVSERKKQKKKKNFKRT